MEQTDILLIEDFLDGDVAALETLVEKYKRMVYRVAIKITENHEDANDVVQETFLKVYKSLNKFKKESSFETWLYRIVVNLSLNAVKRRKRRRELSIDEIYEKETKNGFIASSEAIADKLESRDDGPSRRVERKELRQAVTQAVDSLPSKQKIVVILYEFEGLKHSEIASILECSVGTVRSRLYYARQRLRELLTPYIRQEGVGR